MQSRFLLGGMAAVDEDGATRFALLSGLRGPVRSVAPAARPILGYSGYGALTRLLEWARQRDR